MDKNFALTNKAKIRAVVIDDTGNRKGTYT